MPLPAETSNSWNASILKSVGRVAGLRDSIDSPRCSPCTYAWPSMQNVSQGHAEHRQHAYFSPSRLSDALGRRMYPGDGGGEGAGKDEGLNALLQPRDVHNLQEIALHCAQQTGVRDPLVLGMRSLHITQQSCIQFASFNDMMLPWHSQGYRRCHARLW